MKYFIQFFSFLLLLVAASACGAARPLANTADSTRVEVCTERVFIHDTAYVKLPAIIKKVQTLDTTSTLENQFAKSEAIVSADILQHSLETKSAQLPVLVEKEIVYRDSIVFRDRVVKEEVKVEKPLTFWQQLKMKVGVAAIILAGLYGIYQILKLYLSKKS